MKIVIIVAAALSLSACGSHYTPGFMTAQEKLDSATIACRKGTQYIYIQNSGYSSSWVQPLGLDGKPFPC